MCAWGHVRVWGFPEFRMEVELVALHCRCPGRTHPTATDLCPAVPTEQDSTVLAVQLVFGRQTIESWSSLWFVLTRPLPCPLLCLWCSEMGSSIAFAGTGLLTPLPQPPEC